MAVFFVTVEEDLRIEMSCTLLDMAHVANPCSMKNQHIYTYLKLCTLFKIGDLLLLPPDITAQHVNMG